jgi:hypothetical protein
MDKILIGLSIIILTATTGTAKAIVFTDSFDDPAFTNTNWQNGTPETPQTWSFVPLNSTDLGYQATVDTYTTTEPAVKFHETSTYYNAGVNIELLVRIDSHIQADSTTNKAVISFGSIAGEGYSAGIQLDNSPNPTYNLSNHLYLKSGAGSGMEGTIYAQLPIPIIFDTFYKLAVQVDLDESINLSLYELDNTLLGSIESPNMITSNIGDYVAFYGRYATTFNDFYFSGTSVVPTPSMVWLFGTGLIILMGVSRSKKT